MYYGKWMNTKTINNKTENKKTENKRQLKLIQINGWRNHTSIQLLSS